MIRILALLSFFTIGVSHASFVPEEIRLGYLKHDIKGFNLCRRDEKGYDVNAELLWASPKNEVFQFLYSPRPHLGFSINTEGGTDQFYAGLTWRYDFLQYLFVEGGFGGEYNTGRTNTASSRKKAIGAKVMFHESVSLGIQVAQHSISVYLDHTSNASLAKYNPGLTDLGLRYGYRF